MTDYPELYRQLAREIVKHEGRIEGDAKQFVINLAEKLRARGHQLTPEIEQELTAYLESMQGAIRTGVETAVTVGATLSRDQGSLPQSEIVAKLTQQAFDERWPDGLKLSDRLWNFDESARTGLTKVLRDAAKAGESVNKTIYSMQRTIERAAGGQRFKIVENYADDWVKELHEAAVDMIHNPSSRDTWKATLAEVEERIQSLKATGTRSAAERVFDQIKTAVSKGKEELADKAVKWWLYDKQLYALKRIARTEMATAMHRAVIDGTQDDDSIIGYQWRLSASHPVTDICDYYASVEMGLGKGVFSKDAVPHHKAHPHCMCLLIPRVTAIKQKGSKDYASFIKNLSSEQQQTLLPKWAGEAAKEGVPLEKLIRPDGFGLITRKAATDLINQHTVDNIFKKLAERTKNANSLADLWANSPSYHKHVDKRVEWGHIQSEADYFEKIKAALAKAERLNMVGGKHASVEVVGGDWSVILNHNGLIKTAYSYEANAETYTAIQTRLGHTVYEYGIEASISRQLKKLFDIR